MGDTATYQMLKSLERRDICPEDYDLLGRLDEAIKPNTLDVGGLDRLPTKTYVLSSQDMCGTIVAQNASCVRESLGVDFWKLPLPHFEENMLDANESLANNFSRVDFWKLPMPQLENETGTRDELDSSSTTCSSSSGVCSVCLAELEDGDILRVLPCSHHFHKECIDSWLLHSSTACPVCKRNVCQD